jgi:hypothetical protein
MRFVPIPYQYDTPDEFVRMPYSLKDLAYQENSGRPQCWTKWQNVLTFHIFS